MVNNMLGCKIDVIPGTQPTIIIVAGPLVYHLKSKKWRTLQAPNVNILSLVRCFCHHNENVCRGQQQPNCKYQQVRQRVVIDNGQRFSCQGCKATKIAVDRISSFAVKPVRADNTVNQKTQRILLSSLPMPCANNLTRDALIFCAYQLVIQRQNFGQLSQETQCFIEVI